MDPPASRAMSSVKSDLFPQVLFSTSSLFHSIESAISDVMDAR